MLLAVDTETTGLDLYHGARPFYVTLCDENGAQSWYEWDVDPLTRDVDAPWADLQDLAERLLWTEADPLPDRQWNQEVLLASGLDGGAPCGAVIDRLRDRGRDDLADRLQREYRSELVLQNSKFDVAMLKALWADHTSQGLPFRWQWDRTHDTLIAGHLLASNRPHDLTSMAVQYLGVDIEPLEKALEAAVKHCRLHCQHRLRKWAIAKEGRGDMPSAGDKTWKHDSWLPRALCRHYDLPQPRQDCHHRSQVMDREVAPGLRSSVCSLCNGVMMWNTLRDYANADSSVTVALWVVMVGEIRRRGLDEYYQARRKAMEIAHRMEWRGLTGKVERADEIDGRYAVESMNAGACCQRIAADLGYELTLPKSGNNHSLKHFCFGRDVYQDVAGVDQPRLVRRDQWLRLPVVKRTETGQPSLDKQAMEEYLATLPEGSVQHEFCKQLAGKRSRDTARAYIEGYRRFWLPYREGLAKGFPWFVLHPNLNPCGTDTLRWSSSHPNEQNISKKEGFNLRFIFGPAPGREWWSLDAKNIELRIPFWLAGEKELMDLFERPDDPPYYGSNHLLAFHTVFRDVWEGELGRVCDDGCCKGRVVDEALVGPHCKKKFASTYYNQTKCGNFCKQYGGQRAKTDATFKRQGAFDLIDSRFSKLAAYNRKQVLFAEKHGYVETVPDRSVNPHRGYPVLCTRTDNGRILPTVPLSYHVQSTAMWWTFKAMVRVQAKLDEWRAKDGFDGHICMQVHDELVLDLPKRGDPSKWDRKNQSSPENQRLFRSTNLWRIEVIRKLMARGGEDIGVPTPVGVEFHAVSWDQGVTLA
jgi:hypothetical protein